MGGIVDAVFGGGDAPPPPDYAPLAQASKESAEIAAQLGREQLAETQRQYELNRQVTQPVVDAQLGIMRQGIAQGEDYYNYSKTFRPLEQQLVNEASAGTEAANAANRTGITSQGLADAQTLRDRAAAFEQGQAADIAMATGGNRAIQDKFAGDIENDVGTAVADARVGQTSALNTALRQAMRYGLTVPTNAQTLSNQNAATLAATANNARTGATDRYRSLVAQGIGLKSDAFTTGTAAVGDAMNRDASVRSADRNMKIQDQSLDFARKLDVTGLSRGLPGASSGAYSVATSAGSNATQNQMAPGQSLLAGQTSANNTTLQGRQIQATGLGNVLSAQTSYNGQLSAANTARNGQMLDVVGAGLGAAFSDIRLKRDIVKIGDDPRGFGWYEFAYKSGGGRVIGVMAQEVEGIIPGAVTEVGGSKAVFYNML